MFELPGKEKSLLSTVRAMDCSLTTSMDWPMCTVDGMLPRVPRTNSATSCTVNIWSSSSKIAGKEFNRAAWGGGREEGEGTFTEGGGRGNTGRRVLVSRLVFSVLKVMLTANGNKAGALFGGWGGDDKYKSILNRVFRGLRCVKGCD